MDRLSSQRTGVLIIVASLVSGDACRGAEPRITEFESLKLMHTTEEPVRLRARIEAAAPADSAELWAQSGVDEPQRVLSHKLAVVPRGGELALEWSAGGREYGHALTLRLVDGQGRTLTEAGPVVVEVCDEWGKMVRMTTIHSWRHLEPDFPEATMADFLARQKRDLVNVLEIYEFKCVCGDLTPADVRPHDCADLPSSAGTTRQKCRLSSATAKKWIELGEARGIRMIGYCNMMTAPEATYRRTGRIYKRGEGDELEPITNPWWKEAGWYIPNSSNFGEVFGAELAESVAEYGWDGWFLDSVGGLFGVNATSLDANGKPLSSVWKQGDWQGDSYHGAWDEKGDEFLGELRAELRERGSRPVLICNAMSEALWRGVGGPYWKRLENVHQPFRAEGEPRDGRELFLASRASRHSPVWFAEYAVTEVRAKKAPWSYWHVAVGMRSVREAAAAPLIYHLHLAVPQEDPETYSPPTLKPLLATVLANGLGVSAFTLPMSYQPPESSEANLAIRSYYRFAARYGEFLYDLAWRRSPPDVVDIRAPDNVFWRELVFERRGEEHGREVVMHLINLSGPPKTTMILGPHPTPAARRDIPVRVEWEGEETPSVWAVVADGDQRPRRLSVSRSEGGISFAVPGLETWTMVVVRGAGPGDGAAPE